MLKIDRARSLALAIALCSTGYAAAECVPPMPANSLLTFTPQDFASMQLINHHLPRDATPPGNGIPCTSVRVLAVNGANATNPDSVSNPYVYRWTAGSDSNGAARSLFIRDALSAHVSTGDLNLEVYRQTLLNTDESRPGNNYELRVVLLRVAPGATTVQVLVHGAYSGAPTLASMYVPFSLTADPSCTYKNTAFQACLGVTTMQGGLRLKLHSGAEVKTVELTGLVTTAVQLGNVQSSAGKSGDIFNLGHSITGPGRTP